MLTKGCMTFKTGKVKIMKTGNVQNFDIFGCNGFRVGYVRQSQMLGTYKMK